MKSLSTIRSELNQIAVSNNMSGKAIDLQIELLSYILYNSQAEILSAAREVGLNSAKLINSKIERCLDLMYSVYRGRNARLLIIVPSIIPNQLHYNEFDPLYASNNLYLYSKKSINIDQNSLGTSDDNINTNYVELDPSHSSIGYGGVWVIEGILSDKKLIDEVYQIPSNLSVVNHYLELKNPQGQLYSNISEDTYVRLGEYPNQEIKRISREFIDHVNAPDNTNDNQNNEIIAGMTIQDYGVRLYRRAGYHAGEKWQVKTVRYTDTEFDLDRLNKVKIPLTNDLSRINGSNQLTAWDLLNPDSSDYDHNLSDFIQNTLGYDLTNALYKDDVIGYNTSSCTIFDNAILVPEVNRDDANSLLYYANENARIGSYIRSNYDVTHLFYEYFINQVREADYILNNAADNNDVLRWMLCNFYIPRPGQNITSYEFDQYLLDRSGYMIGYNGIGEDSNILMYKLPAVNRKLYLKLEIYNDGDINLTNDINEILNNWQNSLGKEIRLSEIRSEISKLDMVKFVNRFELISWIDVVDYRVNSDLFSYYSQYIPTSNAEQVWTRSMQLDYGPYNTQYQVGTPLGIDDICKANNCRYFTFEVSLNQLNYYGITS